MAGIALGFVIGSIVGDLIGEKVVTPLIHKISKHHNKKPSAVAPSQTAETESEPSEEEINEYVYSEDDEKSSIADMYDCDDLYDK